MTIDFVTTMSDVSAEQWNALWQTSYPFIQYEFLFALEHSGCVSSQSGWQPQHIIIRKNSKLTAAMPLYVKSHSYGEYVFDWQWADAYHHQGLAYYPKLINAIPFTPATGPRYIAQDNEAVCSLKEGLNTLIQAQKLSGVHSLFGERDSAIKDIMGDNPLQRMGCQFHWFNQNYSNFDDFLSFFSSRKRKNIKKERAKANNHGIEITRALGAELSPTDWQAFYHLYARTYIKRSGHTGYLNEQFFQEIGQRLADKIMMVRAYDSDTCIAAALYFFDDKTLYGRYWGAHEEYDSLHFECCYYQGIEFAIEQNLQRFDPGAQGEHKIQRGFTPVLTQSYHSLTQPGFHSAIASFLKVEQGHIRQYCADARTLLPFKNDIVIVDENILIDT